MPVFPGAADALLFLCAALWLWGGMLYIWMISLIFLSLHLLYVRSVRQCRPLGSIWALWRFQRWLEGCCENELGARHFGEVRPFFAVRTAMRFADYSRITNIDALGTAAMLIYRLA